jgi:predicted chitinase
MATLREMLDFYEGTVFWAGDWNDPIDEMHSQMGYDTYNNPHTQDFINRKIRSDGFSTFRRGGAVPAPTPTPAADAVLVLAEAMGNRRGVDYAAKLPAVQQCLRECDCTTVERIAMWMAQAGHESGGLFYMEEIASGDAYEGRGDLGNTQPGDGRRFKGRGPIQVTGRHNYTELSDWAFANNLVPAPNFFVDHPEELATDRYGFMGVTWYWMTQRPMNDAADARDIRRATQYVNGGFNGLDDRTNRWNYALQQMGDRLLVLVGQPIPAPIPQEDELSAEAERMIRELYEEYRASRLAPTRSFLAPDMKPIESPLGFEWNIDGNVWDLKLTWAYLFGVQRAVEYVERVANEGVSPNSWAGQTTDETGHWDAVFGQQYCQGLIAFRDALQAALLKSGGTSPALPPPDTGALDALRAENNRLLNAITVLDNENSRLREENQQLKSSAAPAVPAVAPVDGNGTTGQVIGKAYDALEALRLADALPIEQRAPLAALIAVLQTKNGSELQ